MFLFVYFIIQMGLRLQLKYLYFFGIFDMISRIARLNLMGLQFRNSVVYCLSAFKSKFQLLQTGIFPTVNHMYKEMVNFQHKLQYQQKLKYQKAIDSLQKKLKKIQKIQISKQSQSTNQTKSRYFNFNEPFEVNISQRMFYEYENKQYQPINQSPLLNVISLDDLYDLIVGSKSMFFRNLDLVNEKILSNPAKNMQLYAAVQQRCQYFQDQLALNVFEDYNHILYESEQSKNFQQASKQKLKSFKGIKSSIEYAKNYKFLLKQNLTAQMNLKASQIAKVLIKYGFGSQKLLMFSSRTLSNQGYKTLSPQSLKNHLFILGYFKATVPDLNDKLFKIFDIFTNSSNSDSLQRNGQIGPLNSLLFYMLSNKIEIYELYRMIFQALAKTTVKGQNVAINACDKELFYFMLRLVKIKYEISPLKILNQNMEGKIVQLQQQAKQLPIVSSNAHQDFQHFLQRKKYKYEKNPQNPHLLDLYSLIQDTVFNVENKNFICLNMNRMVKKTQKTNGIGEIIMQNFKAIGEQVKHINPIVVLNCEKRVQKQEYFKSKLKGIKQPEVDRQRRFNF